MCHLGGIKIFPPPRGDQSFSELQFHIIYVGEGTFNVCAQSTDLAIRKNENEFPLNALTSPSSNRKTFQVPSKHWKEDNGNFQNRP